MSSRLSSIPMAPTDSFQSTSSENDFLSRYDEKEATASLLPPSMAADSWDDGQLEESASRRQKRHWSITRRRMALLVLGAIVLVGGFAGTRRKTAEPAAEVVEGVEREMEGIAVNATTEEIRVQGFDTSLVLNNPFPQATFAMQLKPGVRYITSIGFGGHSNQFIGVVKLIYLAQLTNRVAIVPTLTPLHFMGGPEKVSEFYDLDRFYSATAIPVVDFSAFKSVELSARRDDRISCWSVQEVTPTGGANRAADSMSVHSVGVDFWALPRDMARGLGGNDLSYDSIRLFDFNVWARRMWVETVSFRFSIPLLSVRVLISIHSTGQEAIPTASRRPDSDESTKSATSIQGRSEQNDERRIQPPHDRSPHRPTHVPRQLPLPRPRHVRTRLCTRYSRRTRSRRRRIVVDRRRTAFTIRYAGGRGGGRVSAQSVFGGAGSRHSSVYHGSFAPNGFHQLHRQSLRCVSPYSQLTGSTL